MNVRRLRGFFPIGLHWLRIAVVTSLLLEWPGGAPAQEKPQEGVSDSVTVINPTRVNAVAFAPDRLVVAIAKANTVAAYAPSDGHKAMEYRGHLYDVNDVVFSPDGTQLLTGSSDKTARLWDSNQGTEIRSFAAHTDRVNGVAFAPDANRIVTCSRDKTVIVWDVATAVPTRKFTAHDAEVNAVAFSPDGNLVASGGDGGKVILWDPTSGNIVQTFQKNESPIVDVRFVRTGDQILAAKGDGTAVIWDSSNGREILSVSQPKALVAAVFSRDPRNREAFMTASVEGGARLWEYPSAVLTQAFGEGEELEPITDMDVSPDGSRMVMTTEYSHALVWDVSTASLALTIEVE